MHTSVTGMAWRKVGGLAAAVLIAVSLAPAASATHAPDDQAGTTSTGDVDTYGVWMRTHTAGLACPQVLKEWTVTLELADPMPGDRVSLSAHSRTPPEPAGGAVATFEDPTASVTIWGGGCIPYTEVTGLTVSGDAPYRISWS